VFLVLGHTELTAHRFVISVGVPHLMKYLEESDDSNGRRDSLSSTVGSRTISNSICGLFHSTGA